MFKLLAFGPAIFVFSPKYSPSLYFQIRIMCFVVDVSGIFSIFLCLTLRIIRFVDNNRLQTAVGAICGLLIILTLSLYGMEKAILSVVIL